MNESVKISLKVIERFNLSEVEIKQLITKLQASILPDLILLEPMQPDEVYALEFEQWMIKNHLYAPY